MKAMGAKAMWKLARGHPGVCKSITESRALLCIAWLLEKGDDGAGTQLQYYSAMTIMEITRVAENNLALRHSAFKPSSPAAKADAKEVAQAAVLAVDDEAWFDRPESSPAASAGRALPLLGWGRG
ncbi:Armadillo/beta-catenin-like repeat family protein [Hordeum vulgare]|nr:Armadillo/beta-catenin-like repeat family protein [Hordeum vulgare]